MKEKYIYSEKLSEVENASGVSGILIRIGAGDFVFRRHHSNGEFTDYNINHDDLPVTIDANSLASFYSSGDNHSLDHSPQVFGLKKIEN